MDLFGIIVLGFLALILICFAIIRIIKGLFEFCGILLAFGLILAYLSLMHSGILPPLF